MQVYVIVLLEKSTQAIMEWRLKPDSQGKQRVADSSLPKMTPEKKWKDLTLKIHRRAVQRPHTPVEIFLYLPEGLPKSACHDRILAQVITDARKHAWGAKLYIVWDQTLATSLKLLDLDQFNGLTECLRTLTYQRVTGLIEITGLQRPLGQLSSVERREIIRERAVSSEKRKKELTALVRPDGWSCVVRNESRRLEDLLHEYVKDGRVPCSSPNRLIIFDSSPRFSAIGLLDRFTGLGRKDRVVVATTLESYPAVLKHYPRVKARVLNTLVFNDSVELVYAVLQLNDAAGFATSRQHHGRATTSELPQNLPVETKAVKVIAPIVCRPCGAPLPRRILITAAFDEPFHILKAAEEVGAILGDATFDLDVQAHPRISCDSLPDVLESKQFRVWIHLAHGDHDGLYDPRLKLYIPPERWLNCFRVHRGSLSLVMLSSCQSTRAARLFAAGGFGVAIGFRDKVLVDATPILAKRVVAAAMQDGGTQDAIIAAFHDACISLAARTRPEGERYIDCKPIAYHSVRKLK